MENAIAVCVEITAVAVNGMDGVSMTRKDKLLEARAAISEGMERTAVQRDIWQNELIWWLCKAVLLLMEKEIKNDK